MGRSFQIAEDKIAETEFFYRKIKHAGMRAWEVRYYFSAYLSASRSVTFALQCSLNDHPEFTAWYASIQERLKQDKIAQFMHKARNESQKEGRFHVTGGTMHTFNGKKKIRHYFDWISSGTKGEKTYSPREDVATVCHKHFITLLNIVHECFVKFGSAIDPAQYYTLENLRSVGKSIEDIEEGLGMPRGWTNGIPDEERIRIIRESEPGTQIDVLFIKYLGMDRFCNQKKRKG